ncbi:MAG: PD40 domain-containing protein, partial [Bacteroidales bacterium]|nr:PD40 domain-containing protein [Bacteroidales bacterium]
MKRFSYILILNLLIPLTIFAQSKSVEKGKQLFNDFSYAESIRILKNAAEKNTDIYRGLAESYLKLNDYKEAEKYYALVVESQDVLPIDKYNYAQVLKVNQKYDLAKTMLDKLAKEMPEDGRVIEYSNNNNIIDNLRKNNSQFAISQLSFNSENQDFGAVFYKDKIVFTSSNVKKAWIQRAWNWNKLPFLDLCIAEIDENNEFVNIHAFEKSLNKKFHEGAVSFADSAKIMAFTSQDFKSKSTDGFVKLKIFFAVYDQKAWLKPVAFKYNNDEYNVGQPSLNEDGSILYFVSDMPGGIGGTDIYKCVKDENGDWSKPQNMGTLLNTEGNEMFPFIHESGKLFFASDGHIGLGGLDIFMSQLDENLEAQTLINPGISLNSSYDDFAFILNNESSAGYFSSNRISGSGDDDIYSFKLLKPFGIELKGVTKDENENVLSNVMVSLFSQSGDKLDSLLSDSIGKFYFQVDNQAEYTVLATKDGYTKCNESINPSEQSQEQELDLVLNKVKEYSLYCKTIDKESQMALEGVKIEFITIGEEKSKDVRTTSSSGEIIKKLEGLKTGAEINYEIKISKESYVPKIFNYTLNLDKDEQIELNVEMIKYKLGDDLGQLIGLKPIYFDLNKFTIREDASIELNKIVDFMNKNPTVRIELGSHTDARGKDQYNLYLS